jgi:peptide/nickel transport system permease protein
MSENKENINKEEQYSLSDDRRVRTLSPGALTAKRFFRNRLAVLGLVILAVMFIFSFVGGWVMPYGQDEVFYREDLQMKEYVGVRENTEFRYLTADGQELTAMIKAKFTINTKNESFEDEGVTYNIGKLAEDLYTISKGETLLGVAYKDVINPADANAKFSFNFSFNALKAFTAGEASFEADGNTYAIDEVGTVTLNGEDIAFVNRMIVQSRVSGTSISRQFREEVAKAIEEERTEFSFVDANGETVDYQMVYDAQNQMWSVKRVTSTLIYDAYSFPNKDHLLGTDKNGMDMLTRLMYGGRVSLVIGFIVVFISAFIGIILGGISGYFGGWVDNLIMRIVDIFYCIPSTPLIIILGAAMDGARVDPQIRMMYLMLILGFLGWPGVARMVRGQILSLREQEFMTATESSGLSVYRRIFKHLIPNVIPQLIVTCTMSLGSTIITEATLSFLGLGVKFPFASWGNIMNDVSNSHVLTSYWFIWIPAGVCLVLSVLGFNFVGDGLRDAFDPKMKR